MTAVTLPGVPSALESAWLALLSASRLAHDLEGQARPAAFATAVDGRLRPVVTGSPDTVLSWVPGDGWRSHLQATDPRAALVDLYLPVCSATASRPLTIGHLGQSLDGFIATHSGDSQFVTGDENIVHLHRLRALCDAVVVGAGTVALDDPQLTVRHVPGPNPVRVVFDPGRRLSPDFSLLTDTTAPTLYLCDQSLVRTGECLVGAATLVGLDVTSAGDGVTEALRVLRTRGHARIFVEGGGVTVSAFLEADLLDRLQIAVAPVLIGDGRPAIRLAPHAYLRDCLRPRTRVFQMGADVLFDCDLRAEADADGNARVRRVL